MEHLDILYDHYKDTVVLMKDAQRDRDRFFVIMCILLALLFVFNLDPLSTLSTIQQIAKNQWGVVSIPETNVIRSLLWGLLLYYTIRYIQRNIYSERLTNYIHTIEENFQLNGDLPICREGGNYLQEYPPVLNLIHYIYTIIFPVLYLCLIIIVFINEFQNGNPPINGIIAALDFILVVFYMVFLYRQKLFAIIHRIKSVFHRRVE
ncbi:hypothetical protein DXA92_10605 [Agathobaculum butyriciproducens]|nr:hypothetical protein DXA94_08755 [Agathobaculum butyriciproducens]RGC60042.1 hypothetical protein DXA92_10605 [Agathobaculum butyriciproducens]